MITEQAHSSIVHARIDPNIKDGKEFTAPVCLNPLNGERHFLKNTIKEIQRIIRSSAGIYT